MLGPPLAEVEAKIGALLEAWGYELVAMRYYAHGGRGRLWLVIDKPGGVSVADCETIYERIGDYLDVLDPIPGPYVLEVSSPGVDRLLTKDRHFEEAIGKQVRVKLRPRQGGRRTVTGRLRSVTEKEIEVETERTVERLERAAIDEARALHQWD